MTAPRVFVLGAGRAGRGLAAALRTALVEVTALHGRRFEPDALQPVTAGDISPYITTANVALIAVRDAQTQLAAIGKPAFPVILGAMAKLRDELTDVDSFDERFLESSLMLADETLRRMDGYLDSHDFSTIRPGTDKKYVVWILKWHHKRWLTGSVRSEPCRED